jgi:hypothetical protein
VLAFRRAARAADLPRSREHFHVKVKTRAAAVAAARTARDRDFDAGAIVPEPILMILRNRRPPLPDPLIARAQWTRPALIDAGGERLEGRTSNLV